MDDTKKEEKASAEEANGSQYNALPSSTISTFELIELVRAVKFARPDASIRSVHREITESMSEMEDNGDAKYKFLKNVKLNDVKKVWKKANRPMPPAAASSPMGLVSSSAVEKLPPLPSVPKLYTVGDAGVRTLAREYTERAAATAAQEASVAEGAKEALREEMMKNYVHFFLDVPADRSGTRPHQALIHFNGDGGEGANKKKKKRAGENGTRELDRDGREIVKIQVAAALEGENVSTPMLLYNVDRSARTFIHPPSSADNDDDGGYDKIKEIIFTHGFGGSLGTAGGTKAYFWSRITRRKEGNDVISVDVKSGLPTAQQW